MSKSRSCSSWILVAALAAAACSPSSVDMQAPADANDELSRGSSPHRDAQTSPRDAHGATDALTGDAATASDAGGGTIADGGVLAGAGVVSCYSAYAPSATCALPAA